MTNSFFVRNAALAATTFLLAAQAVLAQQPKLTKDKHSVIGRDTTAASAKFDVMPFAHGVHGKYPYAYKILPNFSPDYPTQNTTNREINSGSAVPPQHADRYFENLHKNGPYYPASANYPWTPRP